MSVCTHIMCTHVRVCVYILNLLKGKPVKIPAIEDDPGQKKQTGNILTLFQGKPLFKSYPEIRSP